MQNEIAGKVVVITGASSGIGLATAVTLAKKGALLALGARREQLLKELEKEVKNTSVYSRALDVTQQDSVEAFVQGVRKKFGRIDVLINNAGVYAVGRFDMVPEEVMRQVMETNFFGYTRMARAVLPYFLVQKDGQIINTISVFGIMAPSLVSAYAASKFAVRGWSHSLRHELKFNGIRVSNIYPSSIDTPIYKASANFTGKEITPLRPVYDPFLVADSIASTIQTGEEEVVVGGYGKVGAASYTLFPQLTETVLDTQMYSDQIGETAMEDTAGNVFTPGVEVGIDGGWRKR